MLHEILVSYGVLFGSGVIAFLIAMTFARGIRAECHTLQQTYHALRTLTDEQSLRNHLELSA